MVSRRMLPILVILSLVAFACGGNGDSGTSDSGDSGELKRVSFRLDWIVNGSHTAFYAAQDQGFFEEEGLFVELVEGAGSGTAATLVGNGTDDFGFSDGGVVARSVAEGVPVTMVMGIFQRNPSIILSLKSAGVESAEDLVGKQVGASAGEAPLQLLPAYLEASGVNEDDVKVVNMDPGAKLPALFQGRVDALVAYDSVELPIAQGEAPEEVNFQHYADAGVVALSNGIIVNPEMVEEDPETVQAFVRAVQKGFEWSQENPEDAVDVLANLFPQTVDKDQALAAFEIVLEGLTTERSIGEPVGYMAPDDWTETLETLQEYGDLTDAPSPEDLYTNEFVEEAASG